MAASATMALCAAEGLGPFEVNTDIGVTPEKGKVEFDGAREYKVTGGGANIWATTDAFHYVWKKVLGGCGAHGRRAFHRHGRGGPS
jgi:hypothetical protein